MKQRPMYKLRRVYFDGTEDAPVLYPVSRLPWSTAMSRRAALGAGVGIAALLPAALGCGGSSTGDSGGTGPTATPTPTPTPTPEPTPAPCAVADVSARAHHDDILMVSVSPAGNRIVSTGRDGVIRLWTWPTGALRARLSTVDWAVGAAEFAMFDLSGTYVVAGETPFNTLALFSADDGRLVGSVSGRQEGVEAMAIVPGTGHVATVDYHPTPGRVVLRTIPALETVRSFPLTFNASVDEMTTSPGGQWLIVRDFFSRTYHVYSLDGSNVAELDSRPHISLDGTHRASVEKTATGAEVTWRPFPSGDVLWRAAVEGANGASLCLSADESRLVCCFFNQRGLPQTLQVRRTQDGTLERELLPPVTPSWVGLAPTGARMVGTEENTLRVWSFPDCRLLKQVALASVSALTDRAISPDGRFLVANAGDGRLVRVSLDETCDASVGYLFDPEGNDPGSSTLAYEVTVGSQLLRYAVPCGSGLPSGATCTCNCVEGTYRYTGGGGGGGGSCSCNQVCICIPVYV